MATSTEELVAEETRRRTPVALVAAAAGICFVVAGVLQVAALTDQPEIQVVDALRERLTPGTEPQLKVQQTLYFDEKALPLLLSALLTSVAAAGSGYVLAFLFKATRAREAATVRIGIIATIVGAVAVAVGSAVGGVVLFFEAGALADMANPTVDDAEDVTQGAALLAASVIQKVIGILALALGFFFVSFNAMKVGLLTRFMGFLGMIAGVMFVLPIIPSGVAILQAVWLALLAGVLLGTGVGGLPPAWSTGRAVRWQSQQQVREQKERAARGGEGGKAKGKGGREEIERKRLPFMPMPKPSSEPEPVPLEKQPAPRPHSTSKKRKKKRRT